MAKCGYGYVEKGERRPDWKYQGRDFGMGGSSGRMGEGGGGGIGGSLGPSTPGFYYDQIVKKSAGIGKAIIEGVKANTGHNDPLELLNDTQLARLKAGLNPLTGEKLKGVQDLVDSITKIYRDNEAKAISYLWSISDFPKNIAPFMSLGFLDKLKAVLKGAGSAVYNEVMAEETDAEFEARIRKQATIEQLAVMLADINGKWKSKFDDKDYKGENKFGYNWLASYSGSSPLENRMGGVIIVTGSKDIPEYEFVMAYEHLKDYPKDMETFIASTQMYKRVLDTLRSEAMNMTGGVKYIVTSGGKTGYDQLVAQAAAELKIPVRAYRLDNDDWEINSNAGKERDSSMIWDNISTEYKTKAISFFDNPKSPGASDTTKKMILAGLDPKMITADVDMTLAWVSTWGDRYAKPAIRVQSSAEKEYNYLRDSGIKQKLGKIDPKIAEIKRYSFEETKKFLQNFYGITKESSYDKQSEDESDEDK